METKYEVWGMLFKTDFNPSFIYIYCIYYSILVFYIQILLDLVCLSNTSQQILSPLSFLPKLAEHRMLLPGWTHLVSRKKRGRQTILCYLSWHLLISSAIVTIAPYFKCLIETKPSMPWLNHGKHNLWTLLQTSTCFWHSSKLKTGHPTSYTWSSG